MARNIDVRTFKQNQLKKAVSLSVAEIDVAKITESYGNLTPGKLAVDDVLTLFKLPPRVLVTNAGIICKSKSKDTTAQLKIDANGNKNLVAATAVGNQDNVVLGNLAGKVYLPTGGDVTATVSVAKLESGVFEVFVEYYEVGKVTGELTN